MTLNNKIAQLPVEQLSWLLVIKDIFKGAFRSDIENKKELIDAVENKAMERGYNEISKLLNSNDLEKYFKHY
jgi:hypothetical protein